jgi:SAM-dependent methyltransferase
MNRKVRRAARKDDASNSIAASFPDRAAEIDHLVAEADRLYRQSQPARVRDICRQILAREPSHIVANNLMGVVLKEQGRDSIAVRHFAKAIALEEDNALFHYNIAYSYQRLNRWDDAMTHFTRAIALKMGGKPVEGFIAQYPLIASCLDRIARQWPRRLTIESLFGSAGVAAVANDAFLRCALEKTEICNVELENFLLSVRFVLLQLATGAAPEFGGVEGKVLGFYAALAQQCFINEYVLAQSDDETQQAERLRSLLLERLAADIPIPPLLLITVAAYFPLHLLPAAAALRKRDWPPVVNGLLRRQLFEPLEEDELQIAIPSLTAVEDRVSVEVKQQYEQNPYPRWTMIPDVSIVGDWHTRFAAREDDSDHAGPMDILVAGCGTGQNSIQAALKFPGARVLAVDLSVRSLAYAMRKTREAGIPNIDYAQADILELGAIGRSFDRITAVGVLHHLADPKAGWRVLLSLLRPGCIMDVGLYSETARRPVVAARAFIASRGYRAIPEDIRRFRRELRVTNPSFARGILASPDFYTTSGCRDLLFHVLEHRFNISDISTFLSENGLAFLGFRLGPEVYDQFRSQFPDPGAMTDLACWDAFEQANPQTFASMYRFAVRKKR